MSNVIGGGSGNNPINLMQFQQTQARKSAFHRGDVGTLGKKETKTKEPGDRLEGISKFHKYSDGRTITKFEDGSQQLKAPNGMMKDIDPDGNTSITLPNGLRIEHGMDGEPTVIDPSTGDFLAATGEKPTPDSQTYYHFKDSQGNKYKVTSDTLRFEVENPSETLTQKVHTSGSMDITSKTLSRDPDSGKFSQDKNHIYIGADGVVDEKKSNLEDLAVNNEGLHFTARGDLDMGIKFPYSPTQHLSGECVKPDMPPITQEPTMPPPQTQPSPQHPPNCGHPGYPGGMPGGYPGGHPGGMPGGHPGGMPGGYPGDSFQQFPWPGYPMPGQMPPPPGPMPGTPPPVQNPFAPIMTPGGMIRKREPDGSLFISLPNGLVMNQMPDGRCQAFDANAPGQVLPVTTTPVDNPGFGPENRYNFQDAQGSLITMYSHSMDFSAASRDGNVLETVSPNGDILINSRTYPPGQDGNPTMKTHKILITAGGRVNTFGERGIQVNNKNIVFAEGGHITNYNLPYEIPPHQGLMPHIPPMGYPTPGNVPVPNPQQPGMYPGNNGMPQFGTPPNMQGSPTMQGEPTMEGEPVYPPGYEGPEETMTPEGAEDASKAGEGNKEPETPAEKPMKPGMWQRIKNFFKGESSKTGKAKKPKQHGQCQGNNWGSSYPGGYYNSYPGMGMGMMGGMGMGMGMGTMMGLGIGATAMMSGMMMYPMGMFCNPFGMFGMGMW
ncbi:MAG: hypothetical protein K8T10_08490 [Candidatus Eremiobacteraeota bacterium]|nr:hypothetical protein [Candidatus Eremiobacteraeota bacterium]